jgi:hypothetical protein
MVLTLICKPSLLSSLPSAFYTSHIYASFRVLGVRVGAPSSHCVLYFLHHPEANYKFGIHINSLQPAICKVLCIRLTNSCYFVILVQICTNNQLERHTACFDYKVPCLRLNTWMYCSTLRQRCNISDAATCWRCRLSPHVSKLFWQTHTTFNWDLAPDLVW